MGRSRSRSPKKSKKRDRSRSRDRVRPPNVFVCLFAGPLRFATRQPHICLPNRRTALAATAAEKGAGETETETETETGMETEEETETETEDGTGTGVGVVAAEAKVLFLPVYRHTRMIMRISHSSFDISRFALFLVGLSSEPWLIDSSNRGLTRTAGRTNADAAKKHGLRYDHSLLTKVLPH